MTARIPASDASITGPVEFDWDGPEIATTAAGTYPGWLASGTYVFRSRWGEAGPVWRSAVWAYGRPAFLVDSDAHTFRPADTGQKYQWRPRSGRGIELSSEQHGVLGTTPAGLARRYRDASGNVIGTRRARVVLSPAGDTIASIYGVANHRPTAGDEDDTFVISVLRPVADPLGLLILTYALCKRPHIDATPQGGGG